MSKWVSKSVSDLSAISWWEQVTFDDDVHCVLDQHA
jgi:hypothetical protein